MTATQLMEILLTQIAESKGSFKVVEEGNSDDPPDDRWEVMGARWDEGRRQFVLEMWSSE